MHSRVFGIKTTPIRQCPSTQEARRERNICMHITKIIWEHTIHFPETGFFVLITSNKAEGEYLLPDG